MEIIIFYHLQKRYKTIPLQLDVEKDWGNLLLKLLFYFVWNIVWATVAIPHIELERIDSRTFCDNIEREVNHRLQWRTMLC